MFDIGKQNAKRADCWLFFEKVASGKVKCRCGHEISFHSSTTNMNNHINEEHADELRQKKLVQINENVRQKSMLKSKIEEQKTSDENLILALCTGNVPIRFVKNRHFAKFVRTLNSDYRLPSPDVISAKLDESSRKYVESARNILRSVEKMWLSCDGWDFRQEGCSLYGYFVYFVNKELSRKSVFLGVWKLDGRGTAENIGTLTAKVLQKFGVRHSSIVGIVSDAASPLVSLANRNDLFHVQCEAHLLSNIISSAATTQKTKQAISKVTGLASYLSRSKCDREVFKTMSAKLGITTRIPLPFSETRWGASVMLVDQYIEHKSSLTSDSVFQKYMATPEELKLLLQFLKFGKPLYSALSRAESDNSCASETLLQLSALREHMKSLPTSKMTKFAIEAISSKHQKAVETDILLMCSLLDPRIAYTENILGIRSWDDAESMVLDYSTSLRNLCGSQDEETEQDNESPEKDIDEDVSESFLKSLQKTSGKRGLKEELLEYKMTVLNCRPPYKKNTNPFTFWKDYADQFPRLLIVASHLNSAPQSSAQTERLFSKCKEIVTSPKRNRMKWQTLNNILLTTSLASLKEWTENPGKLYSSTSDEELDDEVEQREDNEGELSDYDDGPVDNVNLTPSFVSTHDRRSARDSDDSDDDGDDGTNQLEHDKEPVEQNESDFMVEESFQSEIVINDKHTSGLEESPTEDLTLQKKKEKYSGRHEDDLRTPSIQRKSLAHETDSDGPSGKRQRRDPSAHLFTMQI